MTGEWFGCQHYNIKPDIVILGKALGNGFPISAVLLAKKVASQLEENEFIYVQSHQNDPLGCKIAREVISIYKESNIIENVKILEEFVSLKLKPLEKLDSVQEVRGKGLMWAVTLIEPINCKTVSQLMLDKNILVGITEKDNLIRLYPPLTINEKEISLLARALKEVLSE